jgi:hypothetical protein
VIGYSSDSSKFVNVDDDISLGLSGTGSNDPSMSLHSESVDLASSISTTYCQCKNEDSLVECLTCGSYFELDTFCPGYYSILGVECICGLGTFEAAS